MKRATLVLLTLLAGCAHAPDPRDGITIDKSGCYFWEDGARVTSGGQPVCFPEEKTHG